MAEEIAVKVIARIHTDFRQSSGFARRAGLIEEFKELRSSLNGVPRCEALRGIEEYSHLWLIWSFTRLCATPWSPMVRPPRLGGNKRVGVILADLRSVRHPIRAFFGKAGACGAASALGPVLSSVGADLMDGTPIWT